MVGFLGQLELTSSREGYDRWSAVLESLVSSQREYRSE